MGMGIPPGIRYANLFGLSCLVLGIVVLRVILYYLLSIYKFAREFFQKNSARSFRVRAKSDKIAKSSRDFIYFAR